jgi:ankyrin repeat protein
MMFAAQQGHVQVVDLLIASGANAGETSRAGVPVLSFAAWGGNIDIVRRLLEMRVEVNLTDAFGSTPLSTAIKQGHTAVADLLRRHGAR